MQRQGLDLRRYLASQRELSARLLAGDSLERVAPDFLRIVAELLGWRSAAIWEAVEDDPRGRFVCAWDAAAAGAGPPAADPVAGEGAALELPIAVGPGEPVLAIAEFRGGDDGGEAPQPATELLEGFAVQLATFVAHRRSEAQARAAEADAELLRRHFAEVVRGSQNAVIGKDLEGVVTSWNPAAERLYGYGAEEAIGRHISFIVPPDREHEEMRILDRIRAGETLETYETDRCRADGVADLGLADDLADPRPRRPADRRLGDRPRRHRRATPPPSERLPARRQPRARQLARPRPHGADDRRDRGAAARRDLRARLPPPRRQLWRQRRRRRRPGAGGAAGGDPPRLAARRRRDPTPSPK